MGPNTKLPNAFTLLHQTGERSGGPLTDVRGRRPPVSGPRAPPIDVVLHPSQGDLPCHPCRAWLAKPSVLIPRKKRAQWMMARMGSVQFFTAIAAGTNPNHAVDASPRPTTDPSTRRPDRCDLPVRGTRSVDPPWRSSRSSPGTVEDRAGSVSRVPPSTA